MIRKPPPQAAQGKPGPQHQTAEEHGTIKQSQLDRHSAEHTKRGSEGDRRRAANMER